MHSHGKRPLKRLAELGLFRRVRITELPRSGSLSRDVLVDVEETDATTIDYGGGFEICLASHYRIAAANPKTKFKGSEMPVAISVNLIAANAAGSRKLAK